MKNQHPSHKAKLKGTMLDIASITYKGKSGANYHLTRKGSAIYSCVQCDVTQHVADDFGVPLGKPNETRRLMWEKALKSLK